MIQKRYYPLDNEHNVLALLQKGYSFIKVDNTVSMNSTAGDGAVPEQLLTVAVPHTELMDDAEYLLLSQFLKSAPQTTFHVDSSYFHVS